MMFDVFVIQSEAKNLGSIAQHSPVDAPENLRRYAPLDDKEWLFVCRDAACSVDFTHGSI